MKNKQTKRGFSVAELMVGMLAFAILALSMGAMLVYAWLGWRDSTESLNLQRDAMVAMLTIEKEIRNSHISEISGDSDSIDFAAGVVRSTNMVFDASSIAVSPGVVLQSWSTPVIGSNYVAVAFVLDTSRGSGNTTYSMTTYPRNYDESP
jgi:Tfp pilus assembly protein PilW